MIDAHSITAASTGVTAPFEVTAIVVSGYVFSIVTVNWTGRSIQLVPAATRTFEAEEWKWALTGEKVVAFLEEQAIHSVVIRQGAVDGPNTISRRTHDMMLWLTLSLNIPFTLVRASDVGRWFQSAPWHLPLPQSLPSRLKMRQQRSIETASFVVARVLRHRSESTNAAARPPALMDTYVRDLALEVESACSSSSDPESPTPQDVGPLTLLGSGPPLRVTAMAMTNIKLVAVTLIQDRLGLRLDTTAEESMQLPHSAPKMLEWMRTFCDDGNIDHIFIRALPTTKHPGQMQVEEAVKNHGRLSATVFRPRTFDPFGEPLDSLANQGLKLVGMSMKLKRQAIHTAVRALETGLARRIQDGR